jgi:hypothetical protein
VPFTFDNFVARLKCPNCGAISPEDISTFMQTHIRDEPSLAYLGVGHPLRVPLADIDERGYITVRQPCPGQDIRILQTWSCPTCKIWPHWAEVVVHDDVIQSIEPVSLTRSVLDRVHFIEDEARDVAAAVTGQSYADIEREDVVPTLLKVLPDGD